MRIGFLALCFLMFCWTGAAGPKTLDLYIIDVELGNAVLAVSPSGETMLLDTGPSGERYVNRILDAMKLAGARQIDYLVISHYHWDHYGAVNELAAKVPIRHFVDHGMDVEIGKSAEWRNLWGTGGDEPYWAYTKTRDKTQHLVPQPGDVIPIRGFETRVLTNAGRAISSPLAGAGMPNPDCARSQPRSDDPSEDGQSLGVLIAFGKFRFVDLGDLTWNKSRELFCPKNLVGPVDAYLIDHHTMSMDRDVAGDVDWGRSCCSLAEVHGLRPRVAFMSAGEHYIYRIGTKQAWQVVHDSPGLEDLWQTHYASQGEKKYNSPEQVIANMSALNCPGHWIKLSAELDGSFTVTNSRNGYTKRYPARGKGVAQ